MNQYKNTTERKPKRKKPKRAYPLEYDRYFTEWKNNKEVIE